MLGNLLQQMYNIADNAQKNDEQVFLHQGAQLFRHPQHPQDAVQPQIHQHIQYQRNARNKDERKEHALPHPVLLAAAILHGNSRATAHAQAQQNSFSDTSYFTKTFREIKHCTPREYRQNFAGREQSLSRRDGGRAGAPAETAL